jgi:hypothetical protein
MAKPKVPQLCAERVERWVGSGHEWAVVSDDHERPLTEKQATGIVVAYEAMIKLGLLTPEDLD